MNTAREAARKTLGEGAVILAHPLALTAERKLDERRQRALSRYYVAAGATGLAVAVHSTQFAIRDPRVGMFKPVVALAAEEMDRAETQGLCLSDPAAPIASARKLVRIGGVCGPADQAVAEAALLRGLRYDAALVSLAALRDASEDALLSHCRAVAEVMPIMGFYLQPSVGGRVLPYSFWRRFAEIENVVAIKVAPFNRYQTLDVVRAVAESGRDDIALLTGNDDHIVLDLVTPYRFRVGGQSIERRMTGGLLGHWAVWTRKSAALLGECRRVAESGGPIPLHLLRRAGEVTDANAAFFDAANGFAGCIAGIHEVLRRQGLLEGIWLLDPREGLSRGQNEEIERVYSAYPHLNDDEFVAAHREEWLKG